MNGLSWSWIAAEMAVPPFVALLAAYPFWRKDQMIFGNIVGTAVIFASAIGLIFKEYAEIERITNACLDAGTVCWPQPSAFMRFAIYASVGLIEVLALFYVSIRVEDRNRRRGYAPEWR
jgi:hypothetical protein